MLCELYARGFRNGTIIVDYLQLVYAVGLVRLEAAFVEWWWTGALNILCYFNGRSRSKSSEFIFRPPCNDDSNCKLYRREELIYLFNISRIIWNLMVIQDGTNRQTGGREIGRSVINTNKPDQSLFCVLIYLFNNCCTMVWFGRPQQWTAAQNIYSIPCGWRWWDVDLTVKNRMKPKNTV